MFLHITIPSLSHQAEQAGQLVWFQELVVNIGFVGVAWVLLAHPH
jgi:hypothetical protein